MARPIAPRIGERHPKAKLTDDDVRLMRALREQHKMPYREIAEKFECSIWTARDIVTYATR
jgi:DNA-binding Lrp family transcriptional regulator